MKPASRGQPPDLGLLEALVMDALGIGSWNDAVLCVQVQERDATARREQRMDRAQRGGRVLHVVQHEQRDGEVERCAGGRVGRQVEDGRRDVGGTGGQLPAGDLEHPGGGLGEQHRVDIGRQLQAEQAGPGTHVDDAHRPRQRDMLPDDRGGGARSLPSLGRVPLRSLLVEYAHASGAADR